jgi:hypothetical protein
MNFAFMDFGDTANCWLRYRDGPIKTNSEKVVFSLLSGSAFYGDASSHCGQSLPDLKQAQTGAMDLRGSGRVLEVVGQSPTRFCRSSGFIKPSKCPSSRLWDLQRTCYRY